MGVKDGQSVPTIHDGPRSSKASLPSYPLPPLPPLPSSLPLFLPCPPLSSSSSPGGPSLPAPRRLLPLLHPPWPATCIECCAPPAMSTREWTFRGLPASCILYPPSTFAQESPKTAQEGPQTAPKEALSLGLDAAPRERSGRPRLPKIAPRGPQRAQDCLQDGSRERYMAQDSLRHTSKRPQDGPKTVSSALRALQGPPQEAKMAPKPKENQCFLPSRLFASDGLLRPQDGPKMAQESPKRGPRGPQDGPKSAQERSKSGPRGPHDGIFEPPRGVLELTPLCFFSFGL